ncbi:MAG: hypothetical protein J3R72DRAFT_459784 [Linnemannia gamsii]|nr:MAG: hypothetical protein J3R72DRAFT_459784 [Linnemannia gamsii]
MAHNRAHLIGGGITTSTTSGSTRSGAYSTTLPALPHTSYPGHGHGHGHHGHHGHGHCHQHGHHCQVHGRQCHHRPDHCATSATTTSRTTTTTTTTTTTKTKTCSTSAIESTTPVRLLSPPPPIVAPCLPLPPSRVVVETYRKTTATKDVAFEGRVREHIETRTLRKPQLYL